MDKIYHPMWLVVISIAVIWVSAVTFLVSEEQSAKRVVLGDLGTLEGAVLGTIHFTLGTLANSPYR